MQRSRHGYTLQLWTGHPPHQTPNVSCSILPRGRTGRIPTCRMIPRVSRRRRRTVGCGRLGDAPRQRGRDASCRPWARRSSWGLLSPLSPCCPSRVPPGVELFVDLGAWPQAGDGFGEWLPDGSIIRFHLRANAVDAYVYPRQRPTDPGSSIRMMPHSAVQRSACTGGGGNWDFCVKHRIVSSNYARSSISDCFSASLLQWRTHPISLHFLEPCNQTRNGISV